MGFIICGLDLTTVTKTPAMDLMSEHLEIDCPACGVRFELDHAFAGSICRCSSCGALVSVNQDMAKPQTDDEPRHDDPRQNMTAADIHPTVLTEQRAMAGRSVMAYQRDIPPRQTGIRLWRVFVVAMLMGVIVGFAAWLVDQQKNLPAPADQVQRTDTDTATTGTDLSSHAPEFFSIKLDSPAVILIDATLASTDWLDDIKAEIRKLHDVLQETSTPVTFVFFNGTQIDMPRLESSVALDESVLETIEPAGALLPSDAISRLGHDHLSRLVLLSAQPLTANQVQAVGKVLGSEMRFDAVWQGSDPQGMALIVEQHAGKYVTLDVAQ
jgi:DNA-directed RNA polymerase subunit RPC12/RpoP